MQDIIKQWPILILLPMCTNDAGPSINHKLVFAIVIPHMLQVGVWIYSTSKLFDANII